MAEFTSNLIEYLEDKLREFNPNFSVSEGTAVRDLFVKPFSVIFQPIVDEILRVRANLSLKDAQNLSEEDLDLLAANFFVTRRSGSKATGSVRIFFGSPVDEFIAQGTVFVAANGARFAATDSVTITSSGLRLNTFGDLFFQDIAVEAEEAGGTGNIPASLISDAVSGSDKIVDVTNPAAFTGGTDTETNEQLLERLVIAITFRNLINDPGAKLILLENFPRLLDVLVVGFGEIHKIKKEAAGVGTGSQTVFQLSEVEDVIATSVDVFVEVADETVLTGGTTAGFKALDDFPYDPESLKLRAGASFLAGAVLTAGTDFVAGQKVSLADETVATGPVAAGPLPAVDFFPVDASPAIEVRAGASFAVGAPLALTTDYTVNLATGVITLTSAGAALVNLQVPPDVHVKYAATSPNPTDFALLPAGASLVNGASPDDLHASYGAGPLDASLVSGDFFGVVTFTSAPLAGTQVLVDFDYFLMRRDRLSGTNLVLGDDTFADSTNVHIGGKVDYYLKFLGLESKELRVNGMKKTQFLFAQTTNDPSPALDEQYVSGLNLPIVFVRNVERIDTGTNLPSGDFYVEGKNVVDELVAAGPVAPGAFQLDFFPVNAGTLELRAGSITGTLLATPADYTVNLSTGVVTLTGSGAAVVNGAVPPDLHAKYGTGDYDLEIMPNKLNLNLSTRQKLKLTVTNPARIGEDVFFRYLSHQDFQAVQAFLDNPVNRIVTADLLARAPMPVFVDVTVNYSRAQGGPNPESVRLTLVNFINGLKLGKCLSVFDIANTLSASGVRFMQLPITMGVKRINLDFTEVSFTTQNKILVPPNFQYIANTVTVNEVELDDCDEI